MHFSAFIVIVHVLFVILLRLRVTIMCYYVRIWLHIHTYTCSYMCLLCLQQLAQHSTIAPVSPSTTTPTSTATTDRLHMAKKDEAILRLQQENHSLKEHKMVHTCTSMDIRAAIKYHD